MYGKEQQMGYKFFDKTKCTSPLRWKACGLADPSMIYLVRTQYAFNMELVGSREHSLLDENQRMNHQTATESRDRVLCVPDQV